MRLWRASRNATAEKSGNLLAGGLLPGWGIFNLVEGVIDHQILKLHNVREQSGSVEAWNIGFLIFSVALVLVGLALVRSRRVASDIISA